MHHCHHVAKFYYYMAMTEDLPYEHYAVLRERAYWYSILCLGYEVCGDET
jgi:hypothetical protein